VTSKPFARIAADTNVVLSAAVARAVARVFSRTKGLEIVTTDANFEEIHRHLPALAAKYGLEEDDVVANVAALPLRRFASTHGPSMRRKWLKQHASSTSAHPRIFRWAPWRSSSRSRSGRTTTTSKSCLSSSTQPPGSSRYSGSDPRCRVGPLPAVMVSWNFKRIVRLNSHL